MSVTRTPAKHFSPLAIGAPEPYRQLPVRLERMVHFVPPHNEKIRARLGDDGEYRETGTPCQNSTQQHDPSLRGGS